MVLEGRTVCDVKISARENQNLTISGGPIQAEFALQIKGMMSYFKVKGFETQKSKVLK